MRTTIGFVAAVAIALPTHAAMSAAQTCTGHASWTQGRIRAGAMYSSVAKTEFDAGAKTYGGELGIGMANGPFGSISAMRLSYYEDLFSSGSGSSSATLVGARVGFPLLVSADKSFGFCPIATLEHQSGPNGTVTFFGTPTTFTVSTNMWSVGGSAGRSFVAGKNVSVVPFVEARYAKLRSSVTASGSSGGEEHQSLAAGFADAGLGIVLNRVVTVRPSIERPFGLGPDSHPSTAYALAVLLNFGGGGAR